MSTPEGKVKDKIKRLLKKYGAYWLMPVQNGMGSPTVDFLVCHKGQFVGIEAKAPGKQPTDRQRQTMDKMVEAGAACFVVSDELQLGILEYFLQNG